MIVWNPMPGLMRSRTLILNQSTVTANPGANRGWRTTPTV